MALTHSRKTILIVDDSDVNLIVFSEMLCDEYNVLTACNGDKALELARWHIPDLILLDVLMPSMNGYEVLEHLKEDAYTSKISVIFLTGLNSPEEEAKGLSLGGSDFITKPFNMEVLKARVQARLRQADEINRLETLATLDALTGIANRGNFDATLHSEFGRSLRINIPMTIAMIDIDYFKQYNDCYGHVAGDRALKAVARTIASCVKRSGDYAARFGGEEFAVILPETDLAAGQIIGESICLAISGLRIEHAESQCSKFLSVSVGIASNDGINARVSNALQLVKQADERLYKAKAAGRNQSICV
jgi:diguanylate cyclase (GGDEF)-like protein